MIGKAKIDATTPSSFVHSLEHEAAHDKISRSPAITLPPPQHTSASARQTNISESCAKQSSAPGHTMQPSQRRVSSRTAANSLYNCRGLRAFGCWQRGRGTEPVGARGSTCQSEFLEHENGKSSHVEIRGEAALDAGIQDDDLSDASAEVRAHAEPKGSKTHLLSPSEENPAEAEPALEAATPDDAYDRPKLKPRGASTDHRFPHRANETVSRGTSESKRIAASDRRNELPPCSCRGGITRRCQEHRRAPPSCRSEQNGNRRFES